ncbi:MAG: CHAT domain-containing protein [Saprospiraceae bacterium]|nr:CHAT domain-containing protein [Saprospiraceae bacterium]
MKKIGLSLLLVFGLLQGALHGQMMEEFEKMQWQQKDSVIAMLFSAGMNTISHLMIDQAYSKEKELTAPNPLAMAKFSNWQGLKTLANQEYTSAVGYFDESLQWYSQADDALAIDVRSATINLAEAQEVLGDSTSMSTFDMALQMMESSNLGEDREYLDLLQRAVGNRMAFDKFDQAEELAKDAVRIAKSVYTQRSDEYLSSFLTLGKVYENAGEYRKGSNLIMQAFELSKTFLPFDHPQRLAYYFEAIDLQRRLGRSRQIPRLYQEGYSLFTEHEELKETPAYASFLDQMGSYYLDQDSMTKAASYIEEANVLISLRAEKSSRQYIASQINMGNLLSKQDKPLEAETYFTDALQYVGVAFGPNSVIQGDLHAAVSDLYSKLGNERKALANQSVATEIYRQNYGEEDELYLEQLADLGLTYKVTNPDTAQQILEYTYNAYLGKFDLGHPYVFQSTSQLSNLYLEQGNIEKAVEYAQLSATSLGRQLKYTYPLLSEEERLSTFESYRPFLTGLVDLLTQTDDQRLSFEAHVIFSTLQQMRGAVHPSALARTMRNPDEDFLARFKTWRELTDQLYDLYSADRKQQSESPKSIDDLRGSIDSYAKALNATTAVTGVTKGVGTGGTYIEAFDREVLLDTPGLLVFLYGGQGNQSQAIVMDGEPDCVAFWNALQGQVQKGPLYFILHGEMMDCAMEAMQTSEGEIVDENYEVRYLREVTRASNLRLEIGSALLVGGFDYDDNVTPTTDLKIGLNAIVPDSLISRINFNTINGSATELSKVSNLLKKKKWNVDWMGQNGIPGNKETFFKYAADTPDVMHISTFRYFFDPTWKNRPRQDSLVAFSNTTSDPTLRATIVLDEANAIVRRPKLGTSLPGFLTAREISQLDLSSTRLLILSGLSEAIDGSVETDLGMLIDAFQNAGVKHVLYTRQGVAAENKNIFLKEFFKNVHKGSTVVESWKKTKAKLKKKYDPSVWAAFLLVG